MDEHATLPASGNLASLPRGPRPDWLDDIPARQGSIVAAIDPASPDGNYDMRVVIEHRDGKSRIIDMQAAPRMFCVDPAVLTAKDVIDPHPGGIVSQPSMHHSKGWEYAEQYILDTFSDFIHSYWNLGDVQINELTEKFRTALRPSTQLHNPVTAGGYVNRAKTEQTTLRGWHEQKWEVKPETQVDREAREYFSRDAFIGRVDPQTPKGMLQAEAMRAMVKYGLPLATHVRAIEAMVREEADPLLSPSVAYRVGNKVAVYVKCNYGSLRAYWCDEAMCFRIPSTVIPYTEAANNPACHPKLKQL